MPKSVIYADNAATTKLDIDAFNAMKPYLLDEYGNASQPYSFSRSAKKALKESREIIASCINAKPDEIYFTSGGTESDNWVIKSSAFGDREKRGTITSKIEHHAVLRACVALEQLGYPVIYLPVTMDGVVTPEVLGKFVTERTRLVSVMLANNEIGTVEPICELSDIAHKHGAVFHTDAVQAVGHIPIDVQALVVDMLSASAHKFNGPKGIGFLYIRKGTVISSYLDGGLQELGMRAGTENVAAIVGMAVALQKSCAGIGESAKRLREYEDVMLSGLSKARIDFKRNGIAQLPGNLSLSFKGQDGEALLHRLDLRGICVSTGSACDSKNVQVSHVLDAIGLAKEYAKGTIRVSLCTKNTLEEVYIILSELIKILVR